MVLEAGAGAVAKTGLAYLFAGICLGTGFWISRKITDPVDNWLSNRIPADAEASLQRLESELSGSTGMVESKAD